MISKRPGRLARLHRDQRGVVGGVEVLPFGLLIFVAAVLLIANIWAVVDAKMAVNAAAREASRAYVEAPSLAAARPNARSAAEQVLIDSGRDPNRLQLTDNNARFVRCAVVEHQASYPVAALTIPLIGGFGRGFVVHASHRESFDAFRGGLESGGQCE